MRGITSIDLKPYPKAVPDLERYEEYLERKSANNVPAFKILVDALQKLNLFKKTNFMIHFQENNLLLRSVLDPNTMISFMGGRTYIDYEFLAIKKILGSSPKVIFDILHVKKTAKIFQSIGGAYIGCYISSQVRDGSIKVFFLGKTDKMKITIRKYCWLPAEEQLVVPADYHAFSQPVPMKMREPGSIYSSNHYTSNSIHKFPQESGSVNTNRLQSGVHHPVKTPMVSAQHDSHVHISKRINTNQSSSMRISDSDISGFQRRSAEPFSIDTNEQARLGLKRKHEALQQTPSIDLISQSQQNDVRNIQLQSKPMAPNRNSGTNANGKKEEVDQMFDFLGPRDNDRISVIKEENSDFDFHINIKDESSFQNQTFMKKEESFVMGSKVAQQKQMYQQSKLVGMKKLALTKTKVEPLQEFNSDSD